MWRKGKPIIFLQEAVQQVYRLQIWCVFSQIRSVLLFAALLLLIYAALLANRAVAASRLLHNHMLSSVLRAPLTFFETTPGGRILNRFSRDIETVDTVLPELMDSWLLSAFDVLATIAVLLYSTPIFLAVAIPLAVLYYFAQVAVLLLLLFFFFLFLLLLLLFFFFFFVLVLFVLLHLLLVLLLILIPIIIIIIRPHCVYQSLDTE